MTACLILNMTGRSHLAGIAQFECVWWPWLQLSLPHTGQNYTSLSCSFVWESCSKSVLRVLENIYFDTTTCKRDNGRRNVPQARCGSPT